MTNLGIITHPAIYTFFLAPSRADDRTRQERNSRIVTGAILDVDVSQLRISDFIFHVVHHGKEEPYLLDEVPLGRFESFFISRAHDTIKGNRFVFNEGSKTRQLLERISRRRSDFVAVSKELAIDFHSRQDNRIKPGVLIFMRLTQGRHVFYLIVKYDHDDIVKYEIDAKKAILEEITTGFTKSPDALQKSAFIDLTGKAGELTVIDRTVRADITDFFRGFLNVRRKHEKGELSEALSKAVYETIKAHRDELPNNVTSEWRANLSKLAKSGEKFESDKFAVRLFGAHASEAVKSTLLSEVRRKELDGEVFDLDPASFASDGSSWLKTVEGVSIKIAPQAAGTVQRKEENDGSVTITIKTKKLLEVPNA